MIFLHTGVGISAQHSTEELCRAAARRLSDFCSLESSSHCSETIIKASKSAPVIIDNAPREVNREDPQQQVDNIHLTVPLQNLTFQVSELKHNTYTTTRLSSHDDGDGVYLTGDEIQLQGSQDNVWLDPSTSYEAYLIPLSERPTVETSLLYPPPPPPSPGDALAKVTPQGEKINAVALMVYFDEDCYVFHGRAASVPFYDSELHGCTQDVNTSAENNPSDSSIRSDAEHQLLPEILPNPFFELEGNNVEKYTGIECSTPITSCHGTLAPHSSYDEVRSAKKQCY